MSFYLVGYAVSGKDEFNRKEYIQAKDYNTAYKWAAKHLADYMLNVDEDMESKNIIEGKNDFKYTFEVMEIGYKEYLDGGRRQCERFKVPTDYNGSLVYIKDCSICRDRDICKFGMR